MSIISCILTEHDLRLVLLAALVVVSGGWVAFGLFQRAGEKLGMERYGWTFLAAVAAGASVWCTHFIAILAFDVRAPITFDPLLTLASLIVVIAGCGAGFHVALWDRRAPFVVAGGALVGLAIAAMHYTGMMAYRVDGLVEWSAGYVIASVAMSVAFGALAVDQAVRRPWPFSHHLALGSFVLAVVSLHFTGMTALTVTPLVTGAKIADPDVLALMAIAVAGVSLIIVGTGVATYVIDTKATEGMTERLQHMAHNDALTGLPNRAGFTEHLRRELARAKADGCRVAVVGLDLDRFKEINDLRGLEAGDAALKIISQRLSQLRQDGEFVARAGGDEFAAVKRFNAQGDLLDFIARLESALFAPIRIGDFEIVTGASLGVAVYPDDGDTQERLVNNADLAMYRAIADVTRSTCFYEARMDEASRARHTLAQDLRRAVELNQLELHYQVQTSIATGEICGYEALLRWKHPERGMVPPSEFIPIAEETGAILAIGEWVLRTACREAASWSTPHKIAVNLSPVQFAHADLARLVHEVLLQTDLSPSRLELELTESTIIADKARTLHILRQLKALGVTIAIDDFGTGYSSLATLRDFPFDKIKLDRSFMNEVEHNQQAKAVVRAVLSLGKTLEIKVLAEGVETNQQLVILRSEGCDEAQGYLLGRPQPMVKLVHSAREIASGDVAEAVQSALKPTRRRKAR
ncbi:MAG: putative bifunctional diguanylate cyclase/phosphodiesterase [Hyphomicrobiaceae bacterium]